MLALRASHEHHNIFFLTTLLVFYTGIRALWCIYTLFKSVISHGLTGSCSLLFFCHPNIIFHYTSLFISFVPFLSLLSRFFPCLEWWFFTFQCMENSYIPFYSYLMDIGSEVLSWECLLLERVCICHYLRVHPFHYVFSNELISWYLDYAQVKKNEKINKK